jgi:hypothetical protein
MQGIILFWLLVFGGQPVLDISPVGSVLKPHIDPNGAALKPHIDPAG